MLIQVSFKEKEYDGLAASACGNLLLSALHNLKRILQIDGFKKNTW
jgi:hypothetical protein